MKRWIIALTASLVLVWGAILVLMLLTPAERTKEKQLPQGTPALPRPSQMEPNTIVKSPIEEKREEKIEVQTDGRPDTNVTRAVTFSAYVHQNGRPVSGARVRASLVRQGSRPFWGLVIPGSNETDAEGIIESSVLVPQTPDDHICEVAAYHQELGTGYTTTSVKDLLTMMAVDIQLDRGEVIVGRLVDSENRPLPGAVATITSRSPPDHVSITGLGSLTQGDGTFFIPGIQFENTPYQLLLTSETLKHTGGSMSRTSGRKVVKLDRTRHYNHSEKTWDVGEVVLYLTESKIPEART